MRKKTRYAKKPVISTVLIGVVICLLILTVWGFWNQFQKLDEIANYKACLAVEQDPGLAFPCTCRPKALNDSEGFETVYQKTEPLCICECTVGENETKRFEIRRAKPEQQTIPVGY